MKIDWLCCILFMRNKIELKGTWKDNGLKYVTYSYDNMLIISCCPLLSSQIFIIYFILFIFLFRSWECVLPAAWADQYKWRSVGYTTDRSPNLNLKSAQPVQSKLRMDGCPNLNLTSAQPVQSKLQINESPNLNLKSGHPWFIPSSR